MHCFLKDIITERICVCMRARACVHACMHTHTTCLKFLGMSSRILPCFRHWAVYSRLGGHPTIPLMLGLQTSASVAGLLREFQKWAKAVKLTPRQVLAPAEPSRSWSCFFLLSFFPSLPFLFLYFLKLKPSLPLSVQLLRWRMNIVGIWMSWPACTRACRWLVAGAGKSWWSQRVSQFH